MSLFYLYAVPLSSQKIDGGHCHCVSKRPAGVSSQAGVCTKLRAGAQGSGDSDDDLRERGWKF